MRELLTLMKALADENRLRIITALNGRELCLCQIVELLGLATSTVSRHASILQQAAAGPIAQRRPLDLLPTGGRCPHAGR